MYHNFSGLSLNR